MHKYEVLTMPIDTIENEKIYEVKCISETGLGFGEGSISLAKRLESGEVSDNDVLTAGEIISNDPDVFVPVDIDAPDDGCGDGRQAAYTFRLNPTNGNLEEFNKSRKRAKLFGGGLVVASSMWRAVNGSASPEETVYSDRLYIAEELRQLDITFGAHTDMNASGDNSGCGAIDKYPQISRNIVRYRSEIDTTLKALYGESYYENISAINGVLDTYNFLADNDVYFSDASGNKTMDLIKNSGSVIKRLSADHLEASVVLNDIDNTTLDQRALDAKLIENKIKPELQVFVVDIWRGRMYADAVAKIALKHNPEVNFKDVRSKAYADFLIRTIAVSSTLTTGDQPVFARMRDGKADFALEA